MFFRESFSGLCLLAAGYAEVEAGWLQQAAIFIAASAATLYYVRGAIKKIPPDTEKYRHVNDCEKLCQANLDAHEKLDREMNERLASLSGHSAGSRKAIYESVRKLSEDVAALKATGEHQTQQLYALEAKVDKIREDISK
ncbi:MAG: hypothetical protein J6J65_03955 [Opitutales bacterium]|nr:hypothetical protein [Opitutales bacterium]